MIAVVVHRGALVTQAVRADKATMIGRKDHRSPVRQAHFVQRGHNAADLSVDQRHVSPVHSHDALPVLPRVGVEGPVPGVGSLHRGLARKGLCHRRAPRHERGIIQVGVLGRHGVREVRPEEVKRQVEGAAVSPVRGRHVPQHGDGAFREVVAEGALDRPLVDCGHEQGGLAVREGTAELVPQ